jgi:hypothetical protein
MASTRRKHFQQAKRAAAVSVAAATASALVVGAAPLPSANSYSLPVNLAASTTGSPGLPPMELAPGAPDPASIPDLTGGFGQQAYQAFQTYGAQLETAFLNNVNLAGVIERVLGVDPETAINTALANALVSALTGVTIPVDQVPVIGGVLSNAGVTNVAALLSLLGLNLDDPLGLTGPTPGLNIITAGPPFSLLKFLGIDLGWVPGFPNSVAGEINGTEYLGISPVALLQTLKGLPGVTAADRLILDPLILTAQGIFGDADAVDVRVPIVLGFGLGAFAAGMAYPQVVADLPNQPGGANATSSPLAGSITILPMILLRNPGRANGGLFARFYPQAGLLGIDTVTPDTAVSSSSDGTGLSIPVGNTGIVIGDANLIPIKVDGTVEYDPLSDVPAWPNPVSLANSLAALAFPTYIVRGVDAASVTEVLNGQLTPQLAAALGNTSGPLALNLYLTLPVNNALPLLEPVRLPIDVINLFTGANLNNPIATAFEPVLTTLTNLGYTDVQRTVVNGIPVYNRTLDQGNVITPFGTLPSGVDWGQVPGDLLVQFVAGVQKAISDGIVSGTPVVNPLGIIANLLGINLPGATGTSPLTDLVSLSSTSTTAAQAAVPAAVVEAPNPAPNTLAQRNSGPAESDAAVQETDATPAADTESEPEPEKPVKVTTTSPASVKKAAEELNKTAQQGQDAVNQTFKNVADSVNGLVRAVTGQSNAAPASTDKPSESTGGDNAGGGDGGESSGGSGD